MNSEGRRKKHSWYILGLYALAEHNAMKAYCGEEV
jgi:hypothetical protein